MTDLLSTTAPATLGRDTFGPWLRAQRERRGITLTTIAEQTKIKRSLLDSLERGDLSHWPTASIYRRAHMRDYAMVIGLPAESLVAQFVRLFPGPDESVEVSGQDALDSLEASRLTMTLVTSGEVGFRLQLDRLRTALVDLGVVSVSALLVSLVTGGGWLACMGVLWAVYLTVGTVVLGESVGAWLFRRLSRRVGRLRGDTNERQVASVPAVSVRSAASSEISFPVLVAESVTATDLPRETSIH